jgi:hypothetical protein
LRPIGSGPKPLVKRRHLKRTAAPITLNVCCRRRWVFSIIFRLLSPRSKSPTYRINKRLMGGGGGFVSFESFWKKENTSTLSRNLTPDHPFRSLSTLSTEPFWLPIHRLHNLEIQLPINNCTVQWRTKGGGGLECSTPPQKFRSPPKSCQTQPNLWKLLKTAEFRRPTPQYIRKKGSKILKLPRFAIVLH